MKAVYLTIVGLFAGLLALVFKRPPYRTEPKRPGCMYQYPERVDSEERAWLRYERR